MIINSYYEPRYLPAKIMTELSHPLGPVAQTERINSLDVIRGIALLGILLMNVVGFGHQVGAYGDPTISGGATGWNLNAWYINNLLFEGTMRGLFTMLFGAGFILLTTRAEQKGGGIEVADIYYRRIIWLLIFGLIHSYLMLWFGEVLYLYALFGLLLFPLRKVDPKYLVIAGVFLLSVNSFQSYLTYQEDLKTQTDGLAAEQLKEQDQELSEEQQQALKAYEKLNTKTTPEEVEKENEALRKGYLSILNHRKSLVKYFQSTLTYDLWVWDILSVMLIGMAFFKWGIFQGERSVKFYGLMMFVGYAVGLSVNYYETSMVVANNWDVLSMHKAGQTYQLGRLFTTFGHIGLAMLFIRSGILKFLQNALAAVGKMALTNYLMHTVICNIYFMGFGFSMFGKLQRYELYYVVAVVWILQLIYSPLWFRYFRFGPAEWAWRSLTYMKKQPFKR